MPQKKSAKKYIKVTKRNTSLNNAKKKAFREAIKDVLELVKNDKMSDAKKAFVKAQKALDKAAQSGVIKKRAAARKKSRLVKQLKK